MAVAKIEYKNFYYPPGGILMWIIIFLELITFGMALVAMVYYSRSEIDVFHTSRLRLNITIGTINTLFLLTSGFFMAAAVGLIKKGRNERAALFLKYTMLGGVLFLGLKGYEYFEKIEAGLTIGENTFFTFYWLLTLFHVIHVLVGLVILASVYQGLKKNGSAVILEDVEASAAFWHMCDLIWLLLFPIIYLIL